LLQKGTLAYFTQQVTMGAEKSESPGKSENNADEIMQGGF